MVKLTSKYYLIRIAKSKDATDLIDALAAYSKFKKDRQQYAIKQYCDSVKKLDFFSAFESFFIPSY